MSHWLNRNTDYIVLYLLYRSWAFALVALVLGAVAFRARGRDRRGLLIAAGTVLALPCVAFVKASFDSARLSYLDRDLAPVASYLPQARTYLGVVFPAGTKVLTFKPDGTLSSAELQGTASLMGGVPLTGELHPVLMVVPVKDEDTTWQGHLARQHTFSQRWVCAPGEIPLTSTGTLRKCILAGPHTEGRLVLPAGTTINFDAVQNGTAFFVPAAFDLPEIGAHLPAGSELVFDEHECLRSVDAQGAPVQAGGVLLQRGFEVERSATTVAAPGHCAPVTALNAGR